MYIHINININIIILILIRSHVGSSLLALASCLLMSTRCSLRPDCIRDRPVFSAIRLLVQLRLHFRFGRYADALVSLRAYICSLLLF